MATNNDASSPVTMCMAHVARSLPHSAAIPRTGISDKRGCLLTQHLPAKHVPPHEGQAAAVADAQGLGQRRFA
ncbi:MULTISPECIES: hypothetical protein [unclassified Amycolatopsis]|uniref:hypothetical protein n=1 Tax=unclassified Amycolatopsis TaxID=2618356 RepID=UPI001C6A6A75|nr:hypothetical protein [Amycolatopsis sp. DSM 110486]QYN20357.1 hypothetical protein K1T34_48925 [Amycolatopsis sp. DSM 110486]